MADSYAACVLREFPGWCDWVPFSDFNAACQPWSKAELDGYTKCVRDTQERVSGIVSPARAQIEREEGQIEANEVRPGGVSEDLYYQRQSPLLTQIFGTSGAKFYDGVTDVTEGIAAHKDWILYAGLALGVVLLMRGRR